VRDKIDNSSRKFSFVYFYSEDSVNKIIEGGKHFIKGIEIDCRVLTQRHEKIKGSEIVEGETDGKKTDFTTNTREDEKLEENEEDLLKPPLIILEKDCKSISSKISAKNFNVNNDYQCQEDADKNLN